MARNKPSTLFSCLLIAALFSLLLSTSHHLLANAQPLVCKNVGVTNCGACLSSSACVFAMGSCHQDCDEEAHSGATCYSTGIFPSLTSGEICVISEADDVKCRGQDSCTGCTTALKADGASCRWYATMEGNGTCFGGGAGPFGRGVTTCEAQGKTITDALLTPEDAPVASVAPPTDDEDVLSEVEDIGMATAMDAFLDNMTTAEVEIGDGTDSSSNHSSIYTVYQNGEVMHQKWNPIFVVFAYLISCISSYTAVHLMDHGLWRSDELKKAAIIKYPDLYAAFMLGFGAVWCMHFVGMAAVTLEGAPVCYNWWYTLGSLAFVVILMVAAVKVAGNDVFARPDRVEVLEDILSNNFVSEKEAMWAVTRVAAFHKLHYLVAAGLLAASGAIVMHYTGMMAQQGPFRKEWHFGLIAASCIVAIVICIVGFWIIFRLRWKIKQMWLRYVSAAVIAFAVCFLHFFGMASVTYIADNDSPNMCQSTWDQNNLSPSAWTVHQMIVVGIGILVPALSLYIANVINQELILAYQVSARSNAIVSSLFPKQIREKMIADDKSKIRKFLEKKEFDGDSCDDDIFINSSKPIADLFTDTTIMFADIAGFTAWSSEREPSQVFMLLETVYHTFDEITSKHGAFKVETIGDCYVAVCGLPDPRKDHAVAMCKVARDCAFKMTLLTKRLEVVLGPDTGDLNIRIGLHSGPVTAGVLRGDKGRFQLFGDTMNLASRMESTGFAGRIQISEATASLLKDAGKEKWMTPRDSEVFAKGKGMLSTYWLSCRGATPSQASSSDESMKLSPAETLYQLTDSKTSRLIEWNVDLLKRKLKQVVAHRNGRADKDAKTDVRERQSIFQSGENKNTIDEVCEIIELPAFVSTDKKRKQEDPESIVLPDVVTEQLMNFVTCIADLYQNNPFHNFEHASHCTMSCAKLVARIVTKSSEQQMDGRCAASTLHDQTHGVASDPLTQFACILSALIHDVDHQGVPNTALAGSPLADRYGNKSVAEQNSIDVSWELLMDDKYKDLRATIYTSDAEMQRFRQLVVNSVMATDIMDNDLKSDRNNRWEKAFSSQSLQQESPQMATNRKATIVIEHLIQASDVSHTMQHWHVYRKWNERLFEEMYKAYKEGRAEKNPADFWYEGEIGFFDFYILPLAEKLKDCGVFGVSGDEYLNYAMQNRNEWKARGQDVVKEMMDKVNTVWTDLEEVTEESYTSSDTNNGV